MEAGGSPVVRRKTNLKLEMEYGIRDNSDKTIKT